MTDNLKSLFSIEQVPDIFTSSLIKKNENKKQKQIKMESQYGKMLRESKKVRAFYGNLSKKYLQKVFLQSCRTASKRNENIFSILESRLDVVLYRAGFFESIASAKQMVRTGGIMINKKKVISPGYILTPGDVVSLSGKSNKKRLLKRRKAKSKPRFISQIDRIHLFFQAQDENRNHNINVSSSLKKEKEVLPNKEDIENKNLLFKEEIGWRFKTSPVLLSSVLERKAIVFINTINNVLGLKTFRIKSQAEKGSKAVKKNLTSLNLISFFNRSFIVQNKKKNNFFSSHQSTYPGVQRVEKAISKKMVKGVSGLNAFNEKKSEENVFEKANEELIFLNYLLYLKKHFQKKNDNLGNQENSPFFKDQPLFDFKKAKALHLEISYQSLSIIFLFPPQRICFPDFINLSLIYK